jgi:four helix bundle protein
MEGEFYKNLKTKMHEFVLLTYVMTNKFPRSEIYGTTSQVKRAAVSVMLNYVEGFARFKPR